MFDAFCGISYAHIRGDVPLLEVRRGQIVLDVDPASFNIGMMVSCVRDISLKD